MSSIPPVLVTSTPELKAMAEMVPGHLQFVVPSVATSDVSTRMAVLKALANDAGLRLPDTRLPEGTALLPVGEESRRALKGKLDELPDLHVALDAYEASLAAEKPVDVKGVLVQDLNMSATTGELYRKEIKPLGYTGDGFAQVAQFVKPLSIRNGFSENLLALPPALRAQVFNHWSHESLRKEQVVIRTVVGGSERRLIRAVTSERHSLETGDDRMVARALRRAAPGAKVRITREPGGRVSEVEVIWPMLDRQLVVGDVAYGGVRVSNSETKGGSCRVEAFLLRVLCYNFTTAFSEDFEAEELSLRHVGDLTRKLPGLVENAMKRIEPLVFAFGDAYKDAFPGNLPTRGELLQRVGRHFKLPETTLSRAAQLWDADGVKSAGDTRAGLVHALTRASQEQSFVAAGETERVAGRIVIDGWDALN